MTNTNIAAEIDRFCRQIANAAAEGQPERLSQVLEAQKEFVAAHFAALDDSSKKQVERTIEHSLLLAKASRAHCLDAIRANQRKLAVLAAYQAG